MTALPIYSTGTVSVAADGTTVTGVGPLWLTAGNAKPGDIFQSGHFCVFITNVVDETTLTITPWGGSTLSGAAYSILKVSQQRIVGASAAEDVDKVLTALNTSGWFIFVPPAATTPDPSLGNDGQYAMQPTTGKQWVKVLGVWTYQGVYKAFRFTGAYDNATTYSYGDVQTTSGSSYVYINDTPSAGHAAPNPTYWQLLASIGATGNTGATGAGYGGTSTTSLVIGTGSKVFTTQSGLAYQNGARVRATATAGATGWLEGVATYSGTTLTITSDKTNGSGTGTSWNFNVAGEPGAGDMLKSDNLSGLASTATSRTNLGALGKVATQVFSASGTYTPSANMLYCTIECLGGGGGGGGTAAVAASSSAAGGGGAGAYSRTTVTAATIGASQAVTIGAAGSGAAAGNNAGGTGGDTSVGTICVAKGGGGGGGAASNSQGQGGTGGAAASATGTLKVSGGHGATGAGGGAQTGVGGLGGASFFGQGGYGQLASGGGVASNVPGAGGGGAFGVNGAGANGGGAGGAGIVVITEFCSQ